MDTPAPHFLFPLVRVLKIVCLLLILQSQARHWASCLLSLGWCPAILKFVCFLSSPRSWAGFLHLLTSYLQMLTLTVLGGMHRELVVAWWYIWVRHASACGTVRRIPRGVWTGFLMESVKQLVGFVTLWWILSMPDVLPASPCPQARSSSPWYSGLGEKEVSLFGSIPHSWGSQTFTYTLSLSSGRNQGWECLSWHWAVLSLGRGDITKVKPFLLPFSKGPISDSSFFASVVCWNFSTGPGLQQRYSHLWVIVKLGALCREDSRKLFCILLKSRSKWPLQGNKIMSWAGMTIEPVQLVKSSLRTFNSFMFQAFFSKLHIWE